MITDATAATGMPDGRYRLGSLEVEVKDGRCMAGGKLAGSVLTMDRAVRNVVQFARWDLQQAVRLATLNPARVAGVKQGGVLTAGATRIRPRPEGPTAKMSRAKIGNSAVVPATNPRPLIVCSPRRCSSCS